VGKSDRPPNPLPCDLERGCRRARPARDAARIFVWQIVGLADERRDDRNEGALFKGHTGELRDATLKRAMSADLTPSSVKWL
jgi:hypothetical protein